VQSHVRVEQVAHNGFRATAGGPLPLGADGATPEEALRNLRAAMHRQLKNGKEVRSVENAAENPWLAMAGIHDPTDPLVQEWKKEMAAYRQELEDDPDRP